MPALLNDAYGTILSQNIKSTKAIYPKNMSQKTSSAALGTGSASKTAVAEVLEENPGPVAHARPRCLKKDGNYEIHITIDLHDCHLLCLFIGVFTLAVLFNSNKRGGLSAATPS